MKLQIDREKYSVMMNKEEINLPRKQFEILWLLCSVPGKVFSRQIIFEKIWGQGSVSQDRTVDVHLSSLRKKIGPEIIRTIKGIGYKITIDKIELKNTEEIS
ncbi:MAG: winged helix-turn-helix transcriptional regulator [Bacteroidales bacterium]|jgi:two-component system alkaline phosphatase synthesis response regulator PhoP|nr:winged helix-turn-helix transcriptional regulator [Bacteroidales bacterium]